MAGFTNTSYVKIVNSLVDSTMKRLDNPYYKFTDKKPTLTTYYNIDSQATSLDESLGTVYSDIGTNAPIKYNKIIDFCIYGMGRIEADYDYDDMRGITSATIDGEAYILPNTIIPKPADYFVVENMNSPFMFKVTSITPDTIYNGANFYKITYKLDKPDDIRILDQINKTFHMVVDNVGTEFNAIIRDFDYDLVNKLQEVSIELKSYYKSLFYSTRVQTFILFYGGYYFYDPSLIEFMIRNKILDGDIDYLHVTQQMALDGMFHIQYNKSFFRMFETKNIDMNYLIYAQSKYIDQPLSILTTRREDYQEVYYISNTDVNCIVDRYVINPLPLEFYEQIKKKELYEFKTYKNIILKFLLDKPINGDDLILFNDIEFEQNMELFYLMPMLILSLDSAITKLMLENKANKPT